MKTIRAVIAAGSLRGGPGQWRRSRPLRSFSSATPPLTSMAPRFTSMAAGPPLFRRLFHVAIHRALSQAGRSRRLHAALPGRAYPDDLEVSEAEADDHRSPASGGVRTRDERRERFRPDLAHQHDVLG